MTHRRGPKRTYSRNELIVNGFHSDHIFPNEPSLRKYFVAAHLMHGLK